MCEEYQLQTIELLREIRELLVGYLIYRDPLDSILQASATTPFFLDYKERRHLFVWNPNQSAVTLLLEDYGSLSVAPSVWTALPFPTGMRIFLSGQTYLLPLMLRCTDSQVP